MEPPATARLYRNLALIECADAATLSEVLAGPTGQHVVRRLSDTVVVVDHTQVEAILKALRRAGYTPRVSGEDLSPAKAESPSLANAEGTL